MNLLCRKQPLCCEGVKICDRLAQVGPGVVQKQQNWLVANEEQGKGNQVLRE